MEENGMPVLKVSGEIDLSVANSFTEALHECLSRRQSEGGLVVDFTDCSYIDSTGITALFSLRRRLPMDEGEIILRGAQGVVKRVFDITNVGVVFTLQ